MHELSITQNILNIVGDYAGRAVAQKVTVIHLVVGELTGFVDDSIQFYFDMLSPGTMAEGARLEIQRIPAEVRCRSCGAIFALEGYKWTCPLCGEVGGDVQRGREFRIDSIEVVQGADLTPGREP
jgi:hydrogenase nickel incorporation protein HypA/HybF